jgi:hypothetical protein
VRIHEPLVVRARSFAGGQWSALADAEFFVRTGQRLAGDFNASGRVEQADLDLVLLHWGRAGEDVPSGWTGGPAVGTIDQDELDAVLLNWGAELAAATAVPAVPSPLQESVDPLSRWRGRVAVGAGGDELSKGRRAAAQPINSTTGAPPFAKDFALAELAHRRGLQSAVARQ